MIYDNMALNAGVIYERTYDILYGYFTKALLVEVSGHCFGNSDNKMSDLSLLVSISTNGAFACELYLKSMIPKDRLPKGRKGHNLSILFNCLTTDEQNRIRSMAISNMLDRQEVKKYNQEIFEENMQRMSEAFINWRYFYEGKVGKITPQFFKCFMMAIRQQGKNELCE